MTGGPLPPALKSNGSEKKRSWTVVEAESDGRWRQGSDHFTNEKVGDMMGPFVVVFKGEPRPPHGYE